MPDQFTAKADGKNLCALADTWNGGKTLHKPNPDGAEIFPSANSDKMQCFAETKIDIGMVGGQATIVLADWTH